MPDREIEKITVNVTKDVPIPDVKPLQNSNIYSISFTEKDTNKNYSIVTGNTYKIDYNKDIKVLVDGKWEGKWDKEKQTGIDAIAKVTYCKVPYSGETIYICFLKPGTDLTLNFIEPRDTSIYANILFKYGIILSGEYPTSFTKIENTLTYNKCHPVGNRSECLDMRSIILNNLPENPNTTPETPTTTPPTSGGRRKSKRSKRSKRSKKSKKTKRSRK